jgi:hypothetical protein
LLHQKTRTKHFIKKTIELCCVQADHAFSNQKKQHQPAACLSIRPARISPSAQFRMMFDNEKKFTDWRKENNVLLLLLVLEIIIIIQCC